MQKKKGYRDSILHIQINIQSTFHVDWSQSMCARIGNRFKIKSCTYGMLGKTAADNRQTKKRQQTRPPLRAAIPSFGCYCRSWWCSESARNIWGGRGRIGGSARARLPKIRQRRLTRLYVCCDRGRWGWWASRFLVDVFRVNTRRMKATTTTITKMETTPSTNTRDADGTSTDGGTKKRQKQSDKPADGHRVAVVGEGVADDWRRRQKRTAP